MNKKDALKKLDLGLYYLQQELGLRIYFGGRSSLRYQYRLSYGVSHPRQEMIFYEDTVPLWFKEYNWANSLDYDCPEFKVYYFPNDFLPKNIGYTLVPTNYTDIWMASYERAMLETIYHIDLYEDPFDVCCHMRYASDMNTDLLQLLLENCNNNRVKRWFLYLSEKYNHSYLKELDLSKIDLGTEFISDDVNNVKAYEEQYNMEVQIDVFRKHNKDILKKEMSLMKLIEQENES